MLRLSQKAWNNVLIFSMLILIVLLNYDRLFDDASGDARLLVNPQDFIVSLQINQMTFERIGTGWRVSAPTEADLPNIQSEQIERLIAQWQRVSLQKTDMAVDPALSSSPPYLVSLYVAGESSPLLLGLLEVDEQALVVFEGELNTLTFPSMDKLLPTDQQ